MNADPMAARVAELLEQVKGRPRFDDQPVAERIAWARRVAEQEVETERKLAERRAERDRLLAEAEAAGTTVLALHRARRAATEGT